MNWMGVIEETIRGSWATISKMILIVIPLMIFIECLKDTGLLEKISMKAKGVTRVLRLPGETALGVVVALLVGLTFGSGVVMGIKDEVEMNRFQLNVLFIFVGIAHALIEETLLFTAIGAYGTILLVNRVVMALLFTFLYIYMNQWITRKKDVGSQMVDGR